MKSKKLIITAALCGAGTMKSQTPYVPVTPEEIAADAVACAETIPQLSALLLQTQEAPQDGAIST